MRHCLRSAVCCLLCICLLPALSLAETAEVIALNPGDRGEEVIRLQERLHVLGLFSGAVDGIYGNQTMSAVSQAQLLLQKLGGYDVSISGHADLPTVTLLYTDEEEVLFVLGSLCEGCSGERVKSMQERLIELNLLRGVADGDFGSGTRAAVELFQNKLIAFGISNSPATGVADPVTLNLLFSNLSEYGFKCPAYFDENAPLSLCGDYLYSPSCILIDGPSGQILFEHNAHERMYPASTTKILTLLTSLDFGNLDGKYTVPDAAADVPQDSSLVPVYPGEKMRKIDLLHGLMLRSGNDAANAIAVIDADSVDAFMDLMNQKAQSLGMYESHFVNPHGYHDQEHYTTAYDLSLATRAGLTDPTFCNIVTCIEYTMPPTKNREALTLKSTYEIFDPNSQYYIPYAAGVKSGFTSHAGFCFVGAAQYNGKTLIAVILNAPTRNAAWLDLRHLFAYGYALE